MEYLIKALQILLKYANSKYIIHCENNKLLADINPELISLEDITELDKLGCYIDEEREGFSCYM